MWDTESHYTLDCHSAVLINAWSNSAHLSFHINYFFFIWLWLSQSLFCFKINWLAPFFWSTSVSSSSGSISVSAHLINDANIPSNRGYYSQCKCVRVCDHTLCRRVCLGWGRWVSLSDPISPSGPCTASPAGENPMEMQSHSVRVWTRMDTRMHRHINIYSIPPLQGSHAENCFGHGDEEKGGLGCGEEKELFNLHF